MHASKQNHTYLNADSKHPQADGNYFTKREFCFTLDGDIFVRYQSFADGKELENAIKERCPAKIDIGPVYNVDPKRRSAYAAGQKFLPEERELVFDIDVSDYDDVRTCGKDAHICTKCWPLMAAAIHILDKSLREDFGFKHIFYVFSGRRGVHAWVCDDRARHLSDEARSAIAQYLSVYKGQEKGMVKLNTGIESHPFIKSSYHILEDAFERFLLPQQQLLEIDEHINLILGYIPNEQLRQQIRAEWKKKTSSSGDNVSVMRWKVLQEQVNREVAALYKGGPKDVRQAKILEKGIKDIVFAYSYPRLDVEVSKKMNHLLKAPFCVHPKTGKVCVPIDPKSAWGFNPDTVCTVGQLLNELNGKGSMKQRDGSSLGWKDTRMKDAVDVFTRCFLDGMRVENKSILASKVKEGHTPSLNW